MEDVRTFAGQTVTVSFWAKAASGTPKFLTYLSQNFGTGGSPSAQVITAASSTQTITTSWVRYSATIAVPSISGKTIGTSGSNLNFSFLVSCGSAAGAPFSDVGIQNNTFDIWGVQVEAGSTATAFQTATGTIQGELAACQRYYWQTGGSSVYQRIGQGVADSGGAGILVINPVTMRVAPTAVNSSTLALWDGVNIIAVTSLTLPSNAVSPYSVQITASGGTSTTSFRIYQLLTNNSTSGYLGLSAEF
jgi:hypothetical protein